MAPPGTPTRPLVNSLSALLVLAGGAAAPLERGVLSVTPGFLSGAQLDLLRDHLLLNGSRYQRLTTKKTTYARGKLLLNARTAIQRRQLPTPLASAIDDAFQRAHADAMGKEWSSSLFAMDRRSVGKSQHVSWHPSGSDFPPHVDFAPNCVAILIYVSSAGDDFEGGQLQTRGCPSLWQCPTQREDYSLNTSKRLACEVVEEHHPKAGDMIAFLAEAAHAVAPVRRNPTWLS